MSEKTVWVAGENFLCDKCDYGWGIIGIFSTEELAIEHCTEQYHFIGPMIIDDITNFVNNTEGDPVEWKGAYYPLYNEEDGDE